MNQDKAIFKSQCSALPLKNNEILVLILPFKSEYYLFLIPYKRFTKYFIKKTKINYEIINFF